MNILVVGAGAVGKVYGYHLSLGGAKVSFLVKEKHAKDTRAGFYFYPLNNRKHRAHPLYWKDFSILTSNEDAQKEKWDYVILAMSSPALRSGWFDDFIKDLPNTTVVTLQPGILDKDYLLARVSAERLIDGTIHIVGFEAPLPNQVLPRPGTAYWIPPKTYSGFSGESRRVEGLLDIFRRGKFSVKNIPDARKENIVASPALNLFILALEASKWNLSKLRDSSLLKLACLAMPEAVAVQAKKFGVKAPSTFHLTPWFFKGLISLAPKLAPFDFETYLQVHFTKVREQMHEGLDQFIDLATAERMRVRHLEAFRKAIYS